MTDTVAQPPRLGRCLNQGRCDLADTNAQIPLAPDAPLTCPACNMPIVVRPPRGKAQVETEGPRPKPPRRLLMLGGALAVMIGAGAAFGLFAVAEEKDDAPEAAELVPAADELDEPVVFSEKTGNIMMFTLGVTPGAGKTLAPALAAAFLAEKGCESFSEKPVANNRLRLRCATKTVRYFIDIAPTEAGTAFDPGPRRPIDLLITTESAGGARPLDPTTIGFSAAALVVNPANPLRRLSPAKAAAIFDGSIDSFAAVGGPDASIRRIAGPDGSEAVAAFAALAPGGGALALTTRRLGDSAAVASAVAGDPDAIGIVNPLDAGPARLVAIGDGSAAVLPTPEAISAGRYPLASRLRIEIPRGSKIRFARPFAAFAAGSAGQVHVRSAGFVPLPPGRASAAAATGESPP